MRSRLTYQPSKGAAFICCLISIGMIALAGCGKTQVEELEKLKPEVVISELYANTTQRIKSVHLFSDTVYLLKANFSRQADEVLIIDAGTLIKCDRNYGVTINPGGTIQCNGSASDPVVFTSNVPMGTQKPGDWAGISINGRSLSNNPNIANPQLSDNSGSLVFTRIEFAGLTIRNAGDRTMIQNIQISYAPGNAALRIDGGNFNAKNILSYASEATKDLFITNGYAGNLQSILLYRHPFFTNNGTSSDLTGLFIENNSSGLNNALPQTFPTISNLTVLGPDLQKNTSTAYKDTLTRTAALVATGNALFRIRNSLFTGFPATGWYLDNFQTAQSVQFDRAEFSRNVVQINDTARAFYLKPGTYPQYTSVDFTNFILADRLFNERFQTIEKFQFINPFNYDQPNPFPANSSEILKGAGFDGSAYSNSFFTKYSHRGALGTEDWLKGWTNFNPLRTDYNYYY